MGKSYISIQCKLVDTKKYKALTIPFWLFTLPLLIPLQILVLVGEMANLAGVCILKYRILIVNNIAFWFRWDGVNKYKYDNREV